MAWAISSASASLPTGPSLPGTVGMPSSFAVALATILSPMRRMCSAVGPDEGEAVLLDHLGEVGVLGEEAVARMDRVRPGDLGRGQDRHRVQVAVGRLGRADAHALVGESDVHRGRHRRSNARRRWRCPSRGRRARCATPPPRDWRSGPSRTSASGPPTRSPGAARHTRPAPPLVAKMRLTRPGRAGTDRVHHLHRLDDQQRLAFLDRVADLNERRGRRLGREIDGADHGRGHRARDAPASGSGGGGGLERHRGITGWAMAIGGSCGLLHVLHHRRRLLRHADAGVALARSRSR